MDFVSMPLRIARDYIANSSRWRRVKTAVQSDPPIRVVLRALALLRALNEAPTSTVLRLHQRTGIPKPTVVRLLRTLEHDGLVVHENFGHYHLTSATLTLASGFHRGPLLVEAASSLTEHITKSIQWPASLAVPEGKDVIVRYSTTPHSPLAVFHSTLGRRMDMASHAMGRVYLAFCSDDVQSALLSTMFSDAKPAEQKARTELLRRELVLIRERGYSFRDPKLDVGSSTLAVPVLQDGLAVASLSITWFSSVMSNETAIERHLAMLQSSAAQIGERAQALAASHST